MAKKTVISQLASVGEGALGKLAHNPATRSAVQSAIQLKDQLVHGSDAIDERLAAIEKRLDALEAKPKRTATRPRTAAGKTRAAASKAKPSAS